MKIIGVEEHFMIPEYVEHIKSTFNREEPVPGVTLEDKEEIIFFAYN